MESNRDNGLHNQSPMNIHDEGFVEGFFCGEGGDFTNR